ncbi:MAG: hypothetical protein ACK5LK_11165 [Chthoniobacterales bacterium]
MKKTLILAFMLIVLLGVLTVGGLGYYWYTKPIEWGLAAQMSNIPAERRVEILKECQRIGMSDEVLGKVVRELDMQAELGATSEAEAIEKLRQRVIIREHGNTVGFLVKGIRGDKAHLAEIAKKIYVHTMGIPEAATMDTEKKSF